MKEKNMDFEPAYNKAMLCPFRCGVQPVVSGDAKTEVYTLACLCTRGLRLSDKSKIGKVQAVAVPKGRSIRQLWIRIKKGKQM